MCCGPRGQLPSAVSTNADVRREQRGLKLLQNLWIDFLAAEKKSFDFRGNLRACLADGFLQAVEKRAGRLFVSGFLFSEIENIRSITCLD